jgi:hypothetical protein
MKRIVSRERPYLPVLGWNLAQHFYAGQASRDLAQSGHAGLVFGLKASGMPLCEFARTIGCGQREFEAIWDVIEAIVNSDAGHGVPVSKKMMRI